MHRRSVKLAVLISRQQLSAANEERQCIHVALALSSGASERAYQPGDHVGIMPENDAPLVERLLACIDLSAVRADALVVLRKRSAQGDDWTTLPRLPVCSLRDALTRFLDISRPPQQELLEQLAKLCRDPGERESLLTLATV